MFWHWNGMDNVQIKSMARFGLIGKHIDYSFSRVYFSKKFEALNLPFTYENFHLEDISEFPLLLKENTDISGLNVTIPYKEKIIPYLDKIDKKAKKIGAVNTISIDRKGRLKGYNTDCYGFKKSIQPLLKKRHKKALILGTGGASKAIAYTLDKLSIEVAYVSRSKEKQADFVYDELTSGIINKYKIIINCTPVGTFPNTNQCPNIPYDGISKGHLLYDLIYNPELTKFLEVGKRQGAQLCNGLPMLELQAEKAWKIWNKTI